MMDLIFDTIINKIMFMPPFQTRFSRNMASASFMPKAASKRFKTEI